MGKTALAVIAPAETAIGPPSTTARRLVNASLSDNTRRAYALGQLDAWLDGRRLDDSALAAYLAELHDARRAASNPQPDDRVVPLSPQMVGLRFAAAAKAAGLDRRVTAHSGRVGLASELTSRGASTATVMLAGNWKTSRMVAHYSAGATAERGAVARYL